ncbi:hypothetical protein [Tenacibaculum aestuarii]|uniref:hypothetical protein n=1 Tax=Tenacibaculum aestuarii TaxID=362781 RepID=UPI0038944435
MACKRLKDLQEHCSDLALIINQIGYHDLNDWLMISSGVNEIDISWNRFDKTSQREWCRPAYESDLSKERITKNYIKELTIFNYIWGGLEALSSKIFTRTQIKKYGKVNCINKFLNSRPRNLPLYGINCEKNTFFKLLSIIKSSKLIKLRNKDYNNELEIIYEIRNQLAHGSLLFPDEDFFFLKQLNPKYLFTFINTCSRLVLFFIQAIISYHSEERYVYSFFDNLFENINYENYGDDIFKLDYIMSRIHLKKIPLTDMRITLFDKPYFELDN